MYGQSLPKLAKQQGIALRRENNRLIRLIARTWRETGAASVGDALDMALPRIVTLTSQLQTRVAETALEATPTVMETLDGVRHLPRLMPEDAATYAGLSGDGMDLTIVMRVGAKTSADTAITAGLPDAVAKRRALESLVRTARTATADTQRDASYVGAQSVSAKARPIRVLNPPSCARCVILAGTEHGAFQRHPNCDCTCVWAEDPPEGSYADPTDYLDSLDDTQLARVLGSKANARAYKDGADLYQLVNAYRRKGGIYEAQYLGERVRATYEGTSRRAFAARRMVASGLGVMDNRPGQRMMRLHSPRLMPSSIYKLAKDETEARQLLHNYGWIK